MHIYSVEHQEQYGERKQQQATDGLDCICTGKSGPEKNKVPNRAPLRSVEPEVVAIFVDYEEFGRDARRQQPLPLRHDRLLRADDANSRISSGAELAYKLRPAGTAVEIGNLVHGTALMLEGLRGATVAGYDVDLAAGLVQPREQGLVQLSRSTLDKNNSVEVRGMAS
jgi:hypothetical protein